MKVTRCSKCGRKGRWARDCCSAPSTRPGGSSVAPSSISSGGSSAFAFSSMAHTAFSGLTELSEDIMLGVREML
eukprot:13443148-Alexandrium_andersonii.AAC.1